MLFETGILSAIDAIPLESVAWLFMAAVAWYIYKKK